MKNLSYRFFLSLVSLSVVCALHAQTTWTLNPLATFGTRADGSIQPGDSIGIGPVTGNNIQISALGGGATGGIQPGDSTAAPNSTAGFNQRGLAYDPVTGNLIFVDTHTGSGGANAVPTNAAIYVLDSDTGQIKNQLNLSGISGGSLGAFITAGVADDGVIYSANQYNKNAGPLKIYRWSTADTNNPSFSAAPIVAFSNSAPNFERLALCMAIRGAGTNTQILIGSADPIKTGAANAGTGTNVFLLTTADGTNFIHHRMYIPGNIDAIYNDGIAFGPSNTFWVKEVGMPLYYLAYDPTVITNNVASTNTLTVIAKYTASSPTDPMLNLSAITVDNQNKLLAGLEQIGGTATGGRGKVWLFDVSDPTNRAPAILTDRIYTPNFQKATAPMGYLCFANGRLYANVVNNGLLVSTLDSVALGLPVFRLPGDQFNPAGIATDLPATTRIAVGQTAHFEVFATAAVTNYQWYTNDVPIPGANTYYYDVPNAQTNDSGRVYKVVAYNAAGSATSASSTLTIVNASDFFHPDLIWSRLANTVALTDPTNYITSGGGAATPNERTVAYNPLSNQLIIARGPAALANLKIFVVNPDNGATLYTLKTTGITAGQSLTLCGIAVGEDGAVYACGAANDSTFKIYRWADSGSNTLPVTIWGTNSAYGLTQPGSPAAYNPIYDLVGNTPFRFGDNLAVHGSGINTEIVLDSQNSSKYVSIMRPADGTMTNWTATGYLLQNIQGSYGSEAYATVIGRSLQFGAIMNTPFGPLPTFWQKRYNAAAGAPLAAMGYNPGGGLAPLAVANTSPGLFTNGPMAVNLTLNMAAGLNFVGAVNADSANAVDTLDLFDLTNPAQSVLLSRQNQPGGTTAGFHKQNNNAIGQVLFGYNPATGTNYIFVINGNNGIAAYVLSGGVTPPPKILAQPHNTQLLLGTSGALGLSLDQNATVTWFKGTNPPVNTFVTGNSYNIPNAQLNNVGDYFAVATNNNGSVTSVVVHLSVSFPDDKYTLSTNWAVTAGTAYLSANGGANTPNERAFAFNAASNQLILVSCPPNSLNYTVTVVNATSGAFLHKLNTTGVVHEGPSEVTGLNAIDLVGAAAADDGSIYICSSSPNSSGGAFGDPAKMFHVFRWTNSDPATTPVLVYEGDPSGQPVGANLRWGDVMAARGSGTNTELLLNAFEGTFGAVLKPTDSTLNVFTNNLNGIPLWFYDASGGGSIGRSIQFGPTNSVFEKRKGASLAFSNYKTNDQSSSVIFSVDSSTTLGGVAVDTVHNLAIGVDFVGNAASPDAVALYDISDTTSPLLISRYSFPANQVANANFICQTIVSSNRVYSLDGNNGLMAFYINPPVNSMRLNITNTGPDVTLSWGNSEAILQGSPDLIPASWTDLAGPGLTNSVQSAANTNVFYRLIQRR